MTQLLAKAQPPQPDESRMPDGFDPPPSGTPLRAGLALLQGGVNKLDILRIVPFPRDIPCACGFDSTYVTLALLLISIALLAEL